MYCTVCRDSLPESEMDGQFTYWHTGKKPCEIHTVNRKRIASVIQTRYGDFSQTQANQFEIMNCELRKMKFKFRLHWSCILFGG